MIARLVITALVAFAWAPAAWAETAAAQDPESRAETRTESRPAPLKLAPLPDRRHGHRAEALPDGRIVMFGGFDHADGSGDRGTRRTWLFDPATAQWERGGDLNTPMAFHGSAIVAGSAYAIGGNVEKLDAATKTWSVVIGGEPFVASHLGAAASGARILLAGGYPDSRPRLAMVDVATKKWEPLPPYPGLHPNDHFSYVAAFDGVFHVAGGFGGDDFSGMKAHHAWDGREWRPRAPIPGGDAAKFAAWAVDAERRLLVMFGMNGNRVYDARADAWKPLPKPPWSGWRCMPATCAHAGYLYVLGGMSDEREFGVDVYDVVAGRWVR